MILAMDLSLSGSALAVLDYSKDGVKIIETSFINNKKNGKKSHGYRLNNIYTEIDRILKNNAIDDVVRERGFSRFAKATQILFKVVGVCDLTLYLNGIDMDIKEIPPTTVKKVIGGHGRAEKSEVEEGLRKYLIKSQQEYKFETDDISDAVAVGITYLIENKKIKEIF